MKERDKIELVFEAYSCYIIIINKEKLNSE